jgi:hypothetical protein
MDEREGNSIGKSNGGKAGDEVQLFPRKGKLVLSHPIHFQAPTRYLLLFYYPASH